MILHKDNNIWNNLKNKLNLKKYKIYKNNIFQLKKNID